MLSLGVGTETIIIERVNKEIKKLLYLGSVCCSFVQNICTLSYVSIQSTLLYTLLNSGETGFLNARGNVKMRDKREKS
jgi:hypothetical protein